MGFLCRLMSKVTCRQRVGTSQRKPCRDVNSAVAIWTRLACDGSAKEQASVHGVERVGSAIGLPAQHAQMLLYTFS